MRRSVLALGFVAIVVSLTLACDLDRDGRLARWKLEDWGGRFDVRPRYVCPGEPVVVSWELRAIETLTAGRCGPFVGCIEEPTGIRRLIPTEVYLESNPTYRDEEPETLFVGENAVPPDENVGSRTVYPEEDTAFEFYAELEGRGVIERERREVEVLSPSGLSARHEQFTWGCTNGESGSPGWAPVVYERGELTSPTIRVFRVYNYSDEAILLSLRRDRDEEGLPPEIIQAELGPSESTEAFNGEYYGVWTAMPLGYSNEVGMSVCETMVAEGDVALPPDAVAEDAGLPDIRILVQFGCGDGLTPTNEAPMGGSANEEMAGAGGEGGMMMQGGLADGQALEMPGFNDPLALQ